MLSMMTVMRTPLRVSEMSVARHTGEHDRSRSRLPGGGVNWSPHTSQFRLSGCFSMWCLECSSLVITWMFLSRLSVLSSFLW